MTGEWLQDISGDREEDYYLNTNDKYRLHRYGGFSFGLLRPFIPENFGEDGPTEFRKLGVRRVSMVRPCSQQYLYNPQLPYMVRQLMV